MTAGSREESVDTAQEAWSPSGRWLAPTLWWAEGGYLREAHRIVEAASADSVDELEIDTQERHEPAG
jgi:hypothetical protein